MLTVKIIVVGLCLVVLLIYVITVLTKKEGFLEIIESPFYASSKNVDDKLSEIEYEEEAEYSMFPLSNEKISDLVLNCDQTFGSCINHSGEK